jgi:hypothetical protein
VDGGIGIMAVAGGQVRTVLSLAFKDGKIAQIEVIADQTQLTRLDLRPINR